MRLQAVELALSSVASPQRPREPIRRLQSMRQTAAKAGNAVLGVGRFSAKVTAALPLCKYLHSYLSSYQSNEHASGIGICISA